MPDATITVIEQLDTVTAAQEIAANLHRLSRDSTSSELEYHPGSQHSYYRDLLITEGFIRSESAGASEKRLKRHAEQMVQVRRQREERAWRDLRAADLEYRIEPNLTDGTGGFFSPPLWMNELFATANRPGRVLAGLMVRFGLPVQPGASVINVPIIQSGGTVNQTDQVNAAVADQDITDAAGSSLVVPFAGDADVAVQLLELSQVGAALDWALFTDLSESYDQNLEQALLYGAGSAFNQILGAMNVSGINAVAFTSGSPTGSLLDPILGKAAAQVGDNRSLPPECWLMRTARWAWFMSAEDTGQRPFGLDTRVYLGSDDATPDPISGLMGWPVFLDDALPANLTTTISGSPAVATYATTGTQDVILCLRPRDMVLLESDPVTQISREPASGELGARLQMRGYAGSLTARRPGGVSVVGGAGMTVQPGY